MDEINYHGATIKFSLRHYLDGLMQERSNSIANALESRRSCTNTSIFYYYVFWPYVMKICCIHQYLGAKLRWSGIFIAFMAKAVPNTIFQSQGHYTHCFCNRYKYIKRVHRTPVIYTASGVWLWKAPWCTCGHFVTVEVWRKRLFFVTN